MKVKWTRPALLDLDAIGAYVAERDGAAATRLLRRIRDGAKLIGTRPHVGRAGTQPGIRHLALAGTSYTLIYATRDRAVEILSVHHQRRETPPMLGRET